MVVTLTYSSLRSHPHSTTTALFISPGQIDVSTSSFQSNQKIGCWEVSLYPILEVFFTSRRVYLHLNIYTGNPKQPGKKARFSRRLSSTVGLAKRGPHGGWSKPGVRSGEQHLNAGGNRMIEKIMRSLVCLSFSKKAVNTTCLNHHL